MLLFGPFSESLPSYQYVDVVGKPTTRSDFSEPVDGLEAPWGMAQFTMYADRKRVPSPPRSMAALADFARANPGRVNYAATGSGSHAPVPNGGLSFLTDSATSRTYASTPLNTQLAPNMLSPSLGGGQPHQNQQPYLGVNFCIALQGIYPSFP